MSDERELADKVRLHAKLLTVAPEEAVLETMSRAAIGLNKQADIIEYLENEVARLKLEIAMRIDYHEDDIWFWQGNGEDHIASMVSDMTVVMRAGDLKDIVQPKFITSEINNVGMDDYDRAMSDGSEDDYDRAMKGC